MAAIDLVNAGGMAANDDGTLAGKTFTPQAFVQGRRWRELTFRESYWRGTQHDKKDVDFDGRLIPKNSDYGRTGFTQPLLGGTERVSYPVPLARRRPSSPYRLGRAMVSAFTNFVFGEGRFPLVRVPGDDDSQDFLQTCNRVGNLPLRMIYARNLAGAVGSVGLSWSYVDGKPRYQVHNTRNLFVHEWEDRDNLKPAYVTECFKVTAEEWDPVKRLVIDVEYWHRRDWSPIEELVFLPARVEPESGQEPHWEIDTKRSVEHGDHDAHIVWIQNTPSDDIDGLPDYDGQYESLDELDTILSVMVRGAKLNLDPTLVLKADPIMVARMGVKKGSDNALVVDKEGGDAKYLELAGSSIEAGIKLFNEQRKAILECCECVIPDPDQVAAAAQSAAAIKAIYTRMLSRGGVIQEQFGSGLHQLLEPMLFVAQARVAVPVTVYDEDGVPVELDQSFKLPPRAEQTDKLGDDGEPSGDKHTEMKERHPGQGVDVEFEWPPRFLPTAADQQGTLTAISTAVAGKPILSQQTAVELSASAFGREGTEEWARVQADTKVDEQKEQKALDDQNAAAGGQVPGQGHLPPGAKPPGAPKPPGGEGGPPEPPKPPGAES